MHAAAIIYIVIADNDEEILTVIFDVLNMWQMLFRFVVYKVR